MNNLEEQIKEELKKQNKEITLMCEYIEKMLYPRCWDKPEALAKLNESSKIRKEMCNAEAQTSKDRISW